MKSSWILFQAELTSLRHALDVVTARVGLVVILLLGVMINIGQALWFAPHLVTWLQDGSIAAMQHLWFCMSILWLLQLVFTVIYTINHWLNAKQSTLLLPLPLSPATRFYSLYLITFCLGAGTRIILFALLPLLLLAWYAIGWFLVTILGTGIITWLGIMGTLFFLGYLLPSPRLLVGFLVFILIMTGLVWLLFWQAYLSFSSVQSFARPSPLLIGCLLVLYLGVLFGPSATWCGHFYVAAYQRISNQTKGYQAHTPRWLNRMLWHVLGNQPLVRAMIYKGVINQSRIKLNFLRALPLLISIPAFWFLTLHSTVLATMPPTVALVAYSAGAGLYTFFDAIPSPIGSEGMRLQFYLAAPFSPIEILRSKFSVYLASILAECLLLCIICAVIIKLDWPIIAHVLTLTTLITIGMTALLVWGSIWDEKLHLLIEGEIPLLFHEQMPFTPRRIVLLSLCLLFYVMAISLIWSVPFPYVLILLVFIDVFIISMTWKWSSSYLRYLFKKG